MFADALRRNGAARVTAVVPYLAYARKDSQTKPFDPVNLACVARLFEAAGVEQMRFYEVAPNLAMTEHAITIRPLCFSARTFKTLPPDLQQAIRRAGKEAGAYGRQVESSEDAQKLEALEKAGKLKRIAFADRAEMKKRVDPVMAAYAKEIGVDGILARMNALTS